MKQTIRLPKGTFVDLGSLKTGQSVILTKPDGSVWKTSNVTDYLVTSRYVEIHTENHRYVIGGTNQERRNA